MHQPTTHPQSSISKLSITTTTTSPSSSPVTRHPSAFMNTSMLQYIHYHHQQSCRQYISPSSHQSSVITTSHIAPSFHQSVNNQLTINSHTYNHHQIVNSKSSINVNDNQTLLSLVVKHSHQYINTIHQPSFIIAEKHYRQ